MADWKAEISTARRQFFEVAAIAGAQLGEADLSLEAHEAPHKPPANLPLGKQAVYAFWGDGAWLKVGKVGPKSQARFTSQHYNANSAPSTLAASLIRAHSETPIAGFCHGTPKDWITANCHRVNLLMPSHFGPTPLALLEAFLHARLSPRFEGSRS